MRVVRPVCGALALLTFSALATDDLATLDVLDLATAKRIAIRDNPSLQVAEARVRQTRALVSLARSAYWPRLNANASVARVDQAESVAGSDIPELAGSTGFALEDPENYYSVDLTATWVLFDGFARRFSAATALHGHAETEAARDDAKRLLLSAVATAFYSAQLSRERMAIAAADEKFNARLYDEARARREKGAGSLSDEMSFQVRMNAARELTIEARRDHDVARIGLAALLGVDDGQLPQQLALAPLTPVAEFELSGADPTELITVACECRPDVRRAHEAVRRTHSGVNAARGDYYPVLSLSASIEGERAEDAGFESGDFGNTVALGLSFNIFDGFLTRGQIREAKAVRSTAELELESTLIDVAVDVRRKAVTLKAAQEQLLLQRSNADLVRRTRDLVEKEYSAGQTSLVRLNEAQRDLTTADSRLAQARVAVRLAWELLGAAVGGQLTP